MRNVLLLIAVSCIVASCDGGGSPEKTENQAGFSSAIAKTNSFSSSPVCLNGGVDISTGIDDNSNGVLDDTEVDETVQVCNGAPGAEGLGTLVRVDEISPGTPCANGGIKLSVGLDRSGEGTLDADEISQSTYVCNASNGADGFSSLLDLAQESAGGNCAAGGQRISTGSDFNRNGTLDAEEVARVSYVCNALSPVVHEILVNTSFQSDAIGCPNGGLRIDSGLDTNQNDTLDGAEITDTGYVCNGVKGADGAASLSLVRVADEPAGSNCAAGGKAILSGLDANNNQILEDGEVAGTGYACNGQDGAASVSLVRVADEPAGSNCAAGGNAILTGLDANVNQTLEDAEVSHTAYVCNGENGADGVSSLSLVRVDDESAGGNCAAGGKAIRTGFDANSNQILDDGEILNTAYVCNGQDGAPGTSSEPLNYIGYFYDAGKPTLLSCPVTASSNKSVYEYYTVESGGTGTPYKTCYSEYCHTNIEHGTRLEIKNYGVGCANTTETGYECQAGFQWDGSHCVAAPASCDASHFGLCLEAASCTAVGGAWHGGQCQAYCPLGLVPTTRGCEVPVASCSATQAVEDNLCVEIDFLSVGGNICGTYADPIRVTAGQHFVTCNTTFNNRLLIDPGTTLQVDRNWSIAVKNGISADGTMAEPIVIETSPNNPDMKWGGLTISGESRMDRATQSLAGDRIRYMTVSGNSSDVAFDGVGLEGATVNAGGDVYLRDAISVNTDFNAPGKSVRVYGSFVVGSNVTANAIVANGGLLMSSVFGSSLSLQTSVSSSYGDRFMRAAVLYNDEVTFSCSGSDAFIQGNRIATAGAGGSASCAVSDNGDPMTSKYAAYILGPGTRTVGAGEAVRLEAYILDKNGLAQPTEVVWKARYDVDGTTFNVGASWEGQEVEIFLPRETYQVYIYSVDGVTDLLGPRSILLDVQ